jgi:acyl-CoA thioester hydrolase
VFRWAEAAETALLRSLGLLEEWADYPRRAVEAEYLAVLRFEDEFDLELIAERVGTSSVTYTWVITRGDELCIRGRHTVVHVDSTGRPAALRPDVRRALAGRRQLLCPQAAHELAEAEAAEVDGADARDVEA